MTDGREGGAGSLGGPRRRPFGRSPSAADGSAGPLESSWEEFLETHAGTIDAVIRPFARTYDERMDLFTEVCAKLRENDMRRLRKFRRRADAPCRFETYLAVVVRNLTIDHLRMRLGRYRAFTNVTTLDETDRLLVVYRFRDGRGLDAVRDRLQRGHGIRLDPGELAARIARIEVTLTASQKWRFLSRWVSRQRALPIDSVNAVAEQPSEPIPLVATEAGPEQILGSSDAHAAFLRAVAALPGRQQLALVLRFRDGNDVETAARTLGVSPVIVERLTRTAVAAIRDALGADRVSREDLERTLGAWWPPSPEADA